jgi:hypothetical protein
MHSTSTHHCQFAGHISRLKSDVTGRYGAATPRQVDLELEPGINIWFCVPVYCSNQTANFATTVTTSTWPQHTGLNMRDVRMLKDILILHIRVFYLRLPRVEVVLALDHELVAPRKFPVLFASGRLGLAVFTRKQPQPFSRQLFVQSKSARGCSGAHGGTRGAHRGTRAAESTRWGIDIGSKSFKTRRALNHDALQTMTGFKPRRAPNRSRLASKHDRL